MNDWEHVNFSQDHELNYHLKKVNKRETEANRATLKVMGSELKSKLGVRVLTHSEFHIYIKNNLHRLD